MCGIVGIADLAGRPVDRELIKSMNDRIVHRGPDDEGYWVGDGVGLAMRRLSIIDLDGGHQPFFNETKTVITVYNGEIYNFQELQQSLRRRGHKLTSNCDTEVIPHLYEEYGRGLVQHLTGMFALAVWDRQRRSLLLARDRLGIKPLHYAVQDGRLYFASELKSLDVCGVLGDLNPEAVYCYMNYGYVPAPLTIYKDVYKVPPGHCVEVVDGQVSVSRYWQVAYEQGESRSEQEWLDELHSLLLQAVKIRMISDVPLGAFVSGGVDSSLIVALMCEVSGSRIKTFSISFDDPAHDEGEYARAVANKFDTDHTELTVRPDLWRHVEDIVSQFDEPFADSSAIPTYFLSKLTREHVTVAMSGDGGDELFGGYDRYVEFFRKRPLYRIPQTMRRWTLGLLGDILPRGTRGKRFLRSLQLDPFTDYISGDGELPLDELFTSDFSASVSEVDAAGPARELLQSGSRNELDVLCGHDLAFYLPDDILTKVDRTSMAVSLEVRVPILDHHVVEFAATLPSDLRLRGRTGKYLLKRLLERYMPSEHVHRPKRGFAIPLGQWFRHELHDELMATLSPAKLGVSGIFDPSAVAFLVDQHMSQKRNHKALLWRLFVFHAWDARRQCAGNDQATYSDVPTASCGERVKVEG